MSHSVCRYHDISCGHRVYGHEGSCQYLHGHNYRIHFLCEAEKLDEVGRVIDFGVIKNTLCVWLEQSWDHKMLLSRQDPFLEQLRHTIGGIVPVPFNPTAENMAEYLVEVIGPQMLRGTGVVLTECRIEETAKCSATYCKRKSS